MRTFFGLIAAGLCIAALAGAGVSWDGSVYLFNLLNEHQPFAPHSRYVNLLVQWPVLLLGAATRSSAVLRTMIGLAYGALPLLSLAGCWWIVRRDARALFVWAALGIALAMLPGMFFVVAEANIAVWLFWPLALAILIGLPRRVLPVVIGLALLSVITHPSAVVLLAVAAGLAFVVGWRDRAQRRRMWLCAGGFAVTALAALARFAVGGTTYERDQLSLDMFGWSFSVAVWGWPLVAIVCVVLAAASLIAAPVLVQRGERVGRIAHTVILASVVIAAAALVVWAIEPNNWKWANKYTLWAPWITTVFAACALIDRLVGSRRAPEHDARMWAARKGVLPFIGAASLIVLAVQSAAWAGVLRRFEHTIAGSAWACVSSAPIAWLNDTPLNQFGTPALGLLLQGQTPSKLVVPNDDCGTQTFVNGYQLDAFLTRPWQSDWFVFDQLRTNLIGEQQYAEGCSFALTTGWYQMETNGPYWWRWSDGRNAALRVVVDQAGTVALTGQIESREQPNTITVLVNGQPQTTIDVTWDGLRVLEPVRLDVTQGINTVQLISERAPTETQGRALAFDLSNVSMVAVEQQIACRFHA